MAHVLEKKGETRDPNVIDDNSSIDFVQSNIHIIFIDNTSRNFTLFTNRGSEYITTLQTWRNHHLSFFFHRTHTHLVISPTNSLRSAYHPSNLTNQTARRR